MIYRRFCAIHFLLLLAQGFGSLLPGAELQHRSGDWTIHGQQTIDGQHIRLTGSLILPPGATLTLKNCTLEIAADYSRQHNVEWKGGTLITENTKIGGFVNDSGTAVHTVFHLYDGLWEATDTTVSYAYGISFHWESGKGILRGRRLKAGPRPDAIILSGQADVELIDSEFPIGLGIYCHQGGRTSLNLMPQQSVTATFDKQNLLPGVKWRLQMTRTVVPRWFLFLRRIGGWQPPAEVTIQQSEDLIVSLLGHNLKGELNLSKTLTQPLQIGNLTLKSADRPAGISMYAVYFSGDETDIAITGKSHICELMHRGGKLRINGQQGPPAISIGCTTLELSGNAQMQVSNVHLGRPLTWQDESSIGEANVTGNAVLTGSDLSVKNVRFRTEGRGRVDLQGVHQFGKIEVDDEGGGVRVEVSQKD